MATMRKSWMRTALTAAAMAAAAGGCAGPSRPSGPAPRIVTAEAFVRTSGETDAKPEGAAAVVASPRATARAATPPTPAAPDADAEPHLHTTASVGEPAPLRPGATSGGPPVLLESLVGQVNGRPVFASEILQPLDAQLLAEARKARSRAEWRRTTEELFAASLSQIVRDELYLAEARASLTPEQKQGLFNFLSKIQEDVVSQQSGSAVAADEATRSAAGLTLQQAAKDRLDRALIDKEVQERIRPRVIVSWRQVQQEYDRNVDKYQPKPTAIYRLIVATTGTPEAERIAAELAAGKPFNDVADGEGNLLARAVDGGRIKIVISGEADQELTGIAELDAAANPLTPGAFAGPIVTGNRTRWVMLERIDQSDPISLYDAQLEIEQELRERRFREESSRYFDRILRRGNVSDIRVMVARLVVIADLRYFADRAQ